MIHETQKILVTGYRGYIGGHIYKKLLEMGHQVSGIDLKDGADLAYCLPDEEYDFVFHLSAMPRVEYSILNPSYTLRQNVLTTSVLLEWAKTHKVKRVIFSSSSAVVGDGNEPNSPYGLQKLMSEMECKLYSKLYKLDTVCLRYFNVYSEDQEYGGAYSTVIAAWKEMMRQQKPLRVDGDGNQSRDFIHVEDIVDVNIFCMNYENRFEGCHFDVGTGKAVSINYIKDFIIQRHQIDWENAPYRQGDVKHTLANITRLKDLNWNAKISIDEGLKRCFGEKKWRR